MQSKKITYSADNLYWGKNKSFFFLSIVPKLEVSAPLFATDEEHKMPSITKLFRTVLLNAELL